MTDEPIVAVSIDTEYTGPAPCNGSMVALGAVAYAFDPDAPTAVELADGSRWYSALEPVNDGHPDTLAWWATQPDAWAEVARAPRPPADAVPELAAWLEALPGRPVMLAWPDSADWPWVNEYLWRYAGRNPLGYRGVCLGSLAAGILHSPARAMGRRAGAELPADWLPEPVMAHHALYDAEAQGRGFQAMLAWVKQMRDLARDLGVVDALRLNEDRSQP